MSGNHQLIGACFKNGGSIAAAIPEGLKPLVFAGHAGTSEAAPFQDIALATGSYS
jgi:hypothetical protein